MDPVPTPTAPPRGPTVATTDVVAAEPDVSIVIPMYNEVENAAPMVDAVQSALADYPFPWELIVVDDGSTDGTADAAPAGSEVRVVRLDRNSGKGAAVRAGRGVGHRLFCVCVVVCDQALLACAGD